MNIPMQPVAYLVTLSLCRQPWCVIVNRISILVEVSFVGGGCSIATVSGVMACTSVLEEEEMD